MTDEEWTEIHKKFHNMTNEELSDTLTSSFSDDEKDAYWDEIRIRFQLYIDRGQIAKDKNLWQILDRK